MEFGTKGKDELNKSRFDTGELSMELIPANFTEPDALFKILEKTVKNYHPSDDLAMIRRAYDLAKKAHKALLHR